MAERSDREIQVVVIGGGPGGYAAAFHAAELGMQVAMVGSDPRPGGVCLHRGCIPSKALLHAAKLVHEAREARHWGLTYPDPIIDLDALRSWMNGVVDKLASGVVELAKRRNVEYLHARATFADSATLHLHPIDGGPADLPEHVHYQSAILATGSRPAIPDALRCDDDRVWDSTAALKLESVPERLLVVGGGYIGLEMGTVYAALGSRVTVVEMTDGLLPGADRDLVRPLQGRLSKEFEAILLGTRVEAMQSRDEGIAVHFKGENAPGEQTFDRVLIAVGRWPNSENLGLEDTRVERDKRGFVRTNEQRRTDDPRIYAIGDVAGEPMLAHKASREGKVAAEAIADRSAAFDNVAIPAVVFTDPEVAWCGLTETQAKAEGREVVVSRFPWGASGRAATLGRGDGLTKLIFEPETQRVLGAGIVGPGAGELIAECVLAVETAAVAADVAESIHAHPTLSETVGEAAEALFGQATHLYRPKR